MKYMRHRTALSQTCGHRLYSWSESSWL